MSKVSLLGVFLCASTLGAFAGGLNTNTNQSVEYLRNPARDGAIGIDGVYSNPAGVAFLDSGLHVSFNIQSAQQERNITSTFSPFAYGKDNGGKSTKKFEGEASAPLVPSLQAAYNWNNWSFQLNVAVTGGGGKCQFDNGLGSFESNVALLPALVGSSTGVDGYDVDCFMKGRSYYIGITLGAAHKLNDNLSVYLGLRGLYGNCSYKGYLKNIQVHQTNGDWTSASQYYGAMSKAAAEGAEKCAAAATQYAAAGDAATAATYTTKATEYKTQAAQLSAVSSLTEDIVLDCDQYGWGFAPILGVDYKLNKLNLSARYEFRTAMRLENDAVNSLSASNIESLAKYKDGATIREDAPALFTLGAQYEFCPKFRAMAGYHLYFDKDTKQYGNHQKQLGGNTTEYLLGMEWDITDRIQFSLGGHRTHFCNTDDYLTDVSFNVSNWDAGTGVGIKITPRLKVNLAYYQSFYQKYTRTTDNYNGLASTAAALTGKSVEELESTGLFKGKDVFERKNLSFGVGVNYAF